VSTLLHTSAVLASLDADEPRHAVCDRVIAAGGHTLYVHALAECEGRGVRGGAVYDFLHLAAARKAGAERLLTLDVSHFQAISRPGNPRIEAP
jgi:hypothetical protein